MFETIKSLKLSSTVLSLKISDEKIVIITNQYLVLVYDINSFEIIYKKQLRSTYENIHMYDRSFAISNNLDIFINIPENLKSYLLKYDDGLKTQDKIEVNKRAVYSTSFNNKADILAFGGEDGKLFFYSIADKNLVGSLETKPDYISNISFSKDDKFAAISSFDKTVTVYSFERACETKSFLADSVIERSAFVDNNSKLITVTRDKKLVTYNIAMGITAESTFEFDEWPSTLLTLNSDYSIVGTRGNSLYIINHSKGTVLSTVNFDNIGISSLQVDKGNLFVAFVNGEIKIINMYSNLEHFKLNLKLNKFSEASKLLEKNIFLSTDESSKKFDEEWRDILSDAKKLLVANKEDEARELVKPFFFDREKEDEFIFCFGNIEHFELFSKLIEEKKYVEAFKLADKYEFLKKSKDFDSIEKHFLKIVHHAKLLFAKDDAPSISLAKKTLLQYSSIASKKTLINNLMSRYKIFIFADKLIKKRDFKQYFQLVKQNDFLKEEEFYNRVILIGNSTFNKLNLYEQEQNYEKALEVAEYLKDFLPFKEMVEQKVEDIKDKQTLLKYISLNKIADVYKLIQKKPATQSFAPYIIFHQKFLDLKKEAHIFANIGDVDRVTKLLEDYLDVNYTIHLVAQEFRIAYLAQMKAYLSDLRKHSVNWDESVKIYESMFGIDNELINFLDCSEFSTTIENLSTSDIFNAYEKVGFVESVIVLNET